MYKTQFISAQQRSKKFMKDSSITQQTAKQTDSKDTRHSKRSRNSEVDSTHMNNTTRKKAQKNNQEKADAFPLEAVTNVELLTLSFLKKSDKASEHLQDVETTANDKNVHPTKKIGFNLLSSSFLKKPDTVPVDRQNKLNSITDISRPPSLDESPEADGVNQNDDSPIKGVDNVTLLRSSFWEKLEKEKKHEDRAMKKPSAISENFTDNNNTLFYNSEQTYSQPLSPNTVDINYLEALLDEEIPTSHVFSRLE